MKKRISFTLLLVVLTGVVLVVPVVPAVASSIQDDADDQHGNCFVYGIGSASSLRNIVTCFLNPDEVGGATWDHYAARAGTVSTSESVRQSVGTNHTNASPTRRYWDYCTSTAMAGTTYYGPVSTPFGDIPSGAVIFSQTTGQNCTGVYTGVELSDDQGSVIDFDSDCNDSVVCQNHTGSGNSPVPPWSNEFGGYKLWRGVTASVPTIEFPDLYYDSPIYVAPESCDALDVDWDPVGQQVVTSQRFSVTKPVDADWDDLFIRASFSYGFDEFFSNNPARTSLYNAVQLAIYIEPVIVSTVGDTRTYSRTPFQPLDNDYFNVICQPADSFAGDDVSVYRRSNGDGGEPEPEGIRGLRPCLYVNMEFETPTSDTRTVDFFIPTGAPLTMGDPGGVIDLDYGQVLESGLRRQMSFDSFSDGAPPFTSGPVQTAGTVDVSGSLGDEFGRQFVVCTDALGEVLFEEPVRPEDGGTGRAVGGPLMINPDAIDGYTIDVVLDPVSGQPIGDPVDGGVGGGTGGTGGPGDGAGPGGGEGEGFGPGSSQCGADWGWEPWSWAGSTLDEMKCALIWAFVPSDMPGWADEQWTKLESQVPFSYGVVLVDFLDVLSDPTTAAAAELCFGAIPMPEYDDGTNTYEPTDEEDACLDIAAQKAAAQENDALLTLLSWCTVGYVMYRFMIGTLGSVFK